MRVGYNRPHAFTARDLLWFSLVASGGSVRLES